MFASLHIREDGSRTAVLQDTAALSARLTAYPADLRHRMHEHPSPHVSLLLSGGLAEATPSGEAEAHGGAVGVKGEGARHAVRFGPQGALILTLAMRTRDPLWRDRAGSSWRAPACRRLGPLLELVLEPGAPRERDEALWDLLAQATDGPATPDAGAVVRRAADRLREEPERTAIADLAAESGLHRAAFTRAFARRYGEPPSVFRRRALTARAVNRLLHGAEPLAQVAVAAGFADQSHMARSVREHTGLTASRLRALLRPVTSVQDAAA